MLSEDGANVFVEADLRGEGGLGPRRLFRATGDDGDPADEGERQELEWAEGGMGRGGQGQARGRARGQGAEGQVFLTTSMNAVNGMTSTRKGFDYRPRCVG